MAAVVEVKYFNTFLLKKIYNGTNNPIWGGSFGIPTAAGGWPNSNIVQSNVKEWVIEETRIDGGYNNSSVDLGVKAYIVEENNTASSRTNSLIYSGIFNSRTGINNTNQFSVGEEITTSLDPSNGSIQKIYAEDTNLIIFQEDKVSRALIDKDAIYSAEGGGTVTSSNTVIGQIVAYAGDYGISKDPESFAVYGYRKYFTDRYRNVVLRLSQDGITEISEYGMSDFFRDEFNSIDSRYWGDGKVIGGWDVHNKQYVISLQRSKTNPDTALDTTLGFNEQSSGFTSFFSFKPSQIISLKNNFYTIKNGSIWLHYSESVGRANFYGQSNKSTITLVLNPEVSTSKSFLTINYEGTDNWNLTSFYTEEDTAVPINMYYLPKTNIDLQNQLFNNNFKRKENKYFGNVLNITSVAQGGEVMYGQSMSGIKGFFATATFSTDNSTVVSSSTLPAELFAVSSNYIQSSY
jgi:hypothetical protein